MYDEDYLDRLEALGYRADEFEGWRFTLGSTPALRPNVRGARWNPPNVSALYMSTTHDGAIAEGEYFVSLFAVEPRGRRMVHRVRATVERLVDASEMDRLRQFGIDEDVLTDSPRGYPPCQIFGGAAAFLDRQAILVPSMRADRGDNLVIFSDQLGIGTPSELALLESIELS